MSNFRATDASGRVIDPATPESLRPMLVELAADEVPGQFLLLSEVERSEVERSGSGVPGMAEARATPTGGGRWLLQVSRGPAERLVAVAPNTDATFDVLRSWAADDGWWAEAFSWTPLDPEVKPEPEPDL